MTEVMPSAADVTAMGAALRDGWALAALFALTLAPLNIVQGWLLIRAYREQVEMARSGTREYREANPVLRELSDTLKVVEAKSKAPEDSALLRRIEELMSEIRVDLRRGERGR